MSQFRGVIYSQSLCMDTGLGVILPQDSRYHRGLDSLADGVTASAKPKTLILLHGLTDNWEVWANRTSILRYAEKYDIAVLMPDGQKSFYQDMKFGPNYYTYITEELPELASTMFGVSTDPDSLMIAGLSMGGYGALYAGLTKPEKYLGVGAFSSAVDIQKLVGPNMPVRKETIGYDEEAKSIFGIERVVPPASDLLALEKNAAKKEEKTRFFITCGEQDEFMKDNENFANTMKKDGLDVHFEGMPGIHEWGVWDVAIQKMLDYFL